MEYFKSENFSLDKNNWNIYNENIVFPFYAFTTSGPFFTIRPTIRLVNTNLVHAMKGILENHIEASRVRVFTNEIFMFSTYLTSIFKDDPIVFKNKTNVFEGGGLYSWQIYEQQDIPLLVEWFNTYMHEVGWKLIGNFKNDNSVYHFFKSVFIKWTMDDPSLDVFERSYPLVTEAHATMIYLGLRDHQDEVGELIDLTREHCHPNSLQIKRTEEFIKHFSEA